MRIAFTLVGGKGWTGGYNYLLNLVNAVATHQFGQLTPVVFFGTDIDDADAAPFCEAHGVEVVHSPLFNKTRKTRSLARALIFGRDTAIDDLFALHRIDVIFEAASFFGWRLRQPAIAWFPDFQHRALKGMFSL